MLVDTVPFIRIKKKRLALAIFLAKCIAKFV